MKTLTLLAICAVGMAFGQNSPKCEAYYPQYCSAGKCEPLQCEFPMAGPLKFIHNYMEGHWIGACGMFPSKGGIFEFVCPSEPKLPIPKELR